MTEPQRNPVGDPPRGLTAHRIGMIAIIALFVIPVALSWSLFYSGWKPVGTVNYGELIHPARPLQTPILDDRFGKAVPEDWMYGKWTLLYLTDTACDESCRQRVITLAKIRLGQNRHIDRIQVALMMSGQSGFATLAEWLRPEADLITMAPIMKDRRKTIGNFEVDAMEGPVFERTYLIDPLGNLMMRYPVDFDPTGLRKDLERLLKLSQVG
ncbi:MAG: hypothetical protein H6981_02725 [Gammaproteobacteria bacterium]|nr:hypothetical protein [Gammaproteobacteria bacterium]MCP5135704.1 hypothetical protein [Gammaproteobacteria bacterium]